MSARIAFEEYMKVTTDQAHFLRNSENKARLIDILKTQFHSAGITVYQAEGDADALIAATAISIGNKNISVAVVGSDSDLLSILIARGHPHTTIYFMKPQTNKNEGKCFHICNIQRNLESLKDSFLFFHAVTGCDTTSAIFNKGKQSAFKILQKDQELSKAVTAFNNSDLDPKTIIEVGERFLVRLYGGKNNVSLDELRYNLYNKTVARKLSSSFNLATLPPTSAAASQHCLRVYLQVQQWLGNNLEPTEWGWHSREGKLFPVTTNLPAVPENLLNLISCQCKITTQKDCGDKCECRKVGLVCSKFCYYCEGNGCSNMPVADDSEDDGVFF